MCFEVLKNVLWLIITATSIFFRTLALIPMLIIIVYDETGHTVFISLSFSTPQCFIFLSHKLMQPKFLPEHLGHSSGDGKL